MNWFKNLFKKREPMKETLAQYHYTEYHQRPLDAPLEKETAHFMKPRDGEYKPKVHTEIEQENSGSLLEDAVVVAAGITLYESLTSNDTSSSDSSSSSDYSSSSDSGGFSGGGGDSGGGGASSDW